MTPAERNTERLRLYRSKMCDAEIAQAVGTCKNTIAYWRRGQNLPPNPNRKIRKHGDSVIGFIYLLHRVNEYRSLEIDDIGRAMDIYRGGALCDLY